MKEDGGLFSLMRVVGVPLPPDESLDGASASVILDEMKSYWRRVRADNNCMEFDVKDHFELLIHYPYSMCKKELTDPLKLLIAFHYYFKPIGINQSMKDANERLIMEAIERDLPSPSYEQLSILFNRSKSTIYEAVHDKESEAQQLIADGQARRQARVITSERLIQEEKEKLEQEKQNGHTDSQTDERTL